MPEKKQGLFESILQRVTAIVQRDRSDDSESSDILTRRETGEHSTTSLGGVYDWYMTGVRIDGGRIAKYRDYDRMDVESPELSSALDMYADNATNGDSDVDEIIKVTTGDSKVKEIIEETIRTMKLDTHLWSIARSLAKYGDVFEEVVVHDDMEVHRLKPLKPETMSIVLDEWGRYDSEYPYEQRSQDSGSRVARFRDWQVIHFRLRRERESEYGVNGSILYSIRKVYKQLAMMEDGMVIARLTRAPQRYAYMVDVDGIDPGGPTLEYLQEVKEAMKKRRMIDPRTGRMDLEYNPLSMEEDLFIGTRQGSNADVKVLQGASNLSAIKDVEYFQNKIFSGIKVPKAYLGFERDVNAKATLTQQDVQFARSVRRIQVALVEGLRKLFDFVLSVRGYTASEIEYSITLPVTSMVDELRKWQVENTKLKVATTLRKELNVSLHWILRHLLEFTEEDIEEIIATLEDEDSIDNLVKNRSAPDEEPETKDDEEPEGEVDDKKPKEEPVSEREIQKLRFRLQKDLEILEDLIDMELERKRGYGYFPQKREAS